MTDEELYAFLPPIIRPARSDFKPHADGYAKWLDVIAALDESFSDRVRSVYYATFREDVQPKPLTPSVRVNVDSLAATSVNALHHFDRAIVANRIIPPSLHEPGIKRRPLLEWRLDGRIFAMGRFKYLLGRCYHSSGRYERAKKCAIDLRTAGVLFLQAGQPDMYFAGLDFCRRFVSLLCEIARDRPEAPDLAKVAMHFSLTILRPEWFLRAFFSAETQWALECLNRLFSGESPRETLRRLSLPFREESSHAPADLLAVDNVSRERGTNSRPSAVSERGTAGQPSVVENTLRLFGRVAEQCIGAFDYPASLAHEKLTQLAITPPIGLLERADESGGESARVLDGDTIESKDLSAEPLVAAFAIEMANRARVNAFLWYQSLSEFRRCAISIAVQIFAKEQARRPQTIDEIVECGILPFVPTDPMSGELLEISRVNEER